MAWVVSRKDFFVFYDIRVGFSPDGINQLRWRSLRTQGGTEYCMWGVFFFLFRATAAAYGSSQARSQIRAAAAS